MVLENVVPKITSEEDKRGLSTTDALESASFFLVVAVMYKTLFP